MGDNVGFLVVGLDVVGLDVVGFIVVGLDVVGLDVVGLDVVGFTVVGLDVVGLDVVGFIVVGLDGYSGVGSGGRGSGSIGLGSGISSVDVSTTAVQQAAAAGVVTSVAMAAIEAQMVLNTPPLSNLTPTCQLTFDSPPQQVVNEPPSTELETFRASDFFTFTVQEAWDHDNIAHNYQTMSSREEFKFLWPCPKR